MVTWLPNKDGDITMCRAHDPRTCRYHKDENGNPLKHYATRDEARKAYEASMRKANRSTGLKKTARKARKNRTFPADRIDDSFLPKEFRGLSLKQIDQKLDRLIEEGELAEPKCEEESAPINDKIFKLQSRIANGHRIDEKDTVRRANGFIKDGCEQANAAIKAIDDKIAWCDGNTRRSRMILKQLEAAHPGVDYGSNEEYGKLVQKKAKNYLERARPITFIDDIKLIDENDSKFRRYSYGVAVSKLGSVERTVNESLHKLEGVRGIPKEIKVKEVTDPDNREFSDYHNRRRSIKRQEAIDANPKLVAKIKQYDAELERINKKYEAIWIGYNAEEMKPFIACLQGVRPVTKDESDQILQKHLDGATDYKDTKWQNLTVLGVNDNVTPRRLLVREQWKDGTYGPVFGSITGMSLCSKKGIIDDNGEFVIEWPYCRDFADWTES